MQMCDSVSECDVTKSQIHGRATDEAFQEQCFLWERGAFVDLFNSRDHLHAQEHIKTLKVRKQNEKKDNRPCLKSTNLIPD